MLYDKENESYLKEGVAVMPDAAHIDNRAKQAVERLLQTLGAVPLSDRLQPPIRVRAAIVNSAGDSLLIIRRQRPGGKVYSVLPGGGVESEDADPSAAIHRELNEEVSLQPHQVTFADRVGTFEQQWWFAGVATPDFEPSEIGGPEAGRVATSGTYEPVWIKLGALNAENLVPPFIGKSIVDAFIDWED